MTSSTNGHGTNGHGSNGHATDGANGNGAQYLPGALWEDGLVPEQTMPDQGLSAQKMTYGSSGIGVHDLVPKLGFREYWYPALQLKQLGKRSFRLFGRRKPVRANIMGQDIVFFEGKKGPDGKRKIAAFWNRCPHRGAIFTPKGRCEFDGTISCPYHGYTFDENGDCVAALTEGPESGQVGKMKARTYPTVVVRDVVFIWMGQTEPVPIEEDVPEEFFDPAYVIDTYRTIWPMNWSLTIENSGDNHSSYIHRFRMRRILNLQSFRQDMAYWPGVKIVEQTDKSIAFKPAGRAPHQAYYPGLGAKWPRHTWWRIMPQRTNLLGRNMHVKPFSHEYRLPSIARVHGSGSGHLHMRWATPIDESSNIHFSFGISHATNPLKRLYRKLYLRFWYRTFVVKVTNELEDVPVQRWDRLDPTAPQKLGANDAPIIIWRRRLPLTSRDNVRVWKKGVKIEVSEDIQVQETREPVAADD